VRDLIPRKHCIEILFTMESRPQMYGSPKEIEAVQSVLYSLLCNEKETAHLETLRAKVKKEMLGSQAPLNIPFSHLIKEDDYVAMVLFLKKIREGISIFNEDG